MSIYQGEVGLQFTAHIANHYSVSQWIELAELAHKHGFSQLWVNDNLGHRNVFVILTAIAARVPIRLGTAILVPYFRNPIDAADSLAALSELTQGREISVGIARGDYAQAGNQIEMIKPIGMVRETVQCLKRLFEGETVRHDDFPILASYYHLKPTASIRLGFSPKAPILFYSGGNGPKIMEIRTNHGRGTHRRVFYSAREKRQASGPFESSRTRQNGIGPGPQIQKSLRDQYFGLQ